MEFDQSIIDLGTQIIGEDAPCGINAKYEPAYEQLEAELAKSESINAGSTDWDAVHSFAIDILQNTSKDFPTACYLTYALWNKQQYIGLTTGFLLLEKLSETHWEGMFPPVKRLRGRLNAAQWLIEKVAPIIESANPSNDEMAVISELASSVKNLDFLLSDKMGDSAPNFAELNRPLKRLKQIAQAAVAEQAASKPTEPKPAQPATQAAVSQNTESTPNPAPEQNSQENQVEPASLTEATSTNTASEPKASTQAKTSSSTKSTAATLNTAPVGDVANDADARKAYRQLQDGLRKLAEFYGQEKASDPRRFRFSRSSLWDSLDKLPPSKEGKTQLPAPPADKIKKLKSLFEAGDFLEVINQGEKTACKLPYWFDGNRYIVMAMDELGGEFSLAKEALVSELRQFITRLPKIVEFSYTNGEPFADAQTQSWVLSLCESNQSPAASTSDSDEIQSVMVEAKKLALSGKLTAAFELFNDCKVTCKRDRFNIKLACAELACISGQEKVGIPMLERMIEETRNLSVADWESGFMAKALALLVNAYEKLNEEDAIKKQDSIATAYDALCWYDPSLAAN